MLITCIYICVAGPDIEINTVARCIDLITDGWPRQTVVALLEKAKS